MTTKKTAAKKKAATKALRTYSVSCVASLKAKDPASAVTGFINVVIETAGLDNIPADAERFELRRTGVTLELRKYT